MQFLEISHLSLLRTGDIPEIRQLMFYGGKHPSNEKSCLRFGLLHTSRSISAEYDLYESW